MTHLKSRLCAGILTFGDHAADNGKFKDKKCIEGQFIKGTFCYRTNLLRILRRHRCLRLLSYRFLESRHVCRQLCVYVGNRPVMTICYIAWGLVRDSIYWDDLYTPVYVVWFTLDGWITVMVPQME